jgi:hypothetical protein
MTLEIEASGDTRFEIRDKLGQGGMGVVYRAHDRRRRHDVALKVLPVLEGTRLFRFKQEFRALAGIVHPNLCTLYDLHFDGHAWMFSMELIEGVGLREFVRPHTHLVEDTSTDAGADDVTRTQGASRVPAPAPLDPRRAAFQKAEVRVDRLRSAAWQLGLGIAALHRAGKLHRDLKPSNVLVDDTGRVVVLDFGLVSELGGLGPPEASTWGTPAYMSPEQVAGAPQSEASDWYSFGVILYEALAGNPPFAGSPAEVMAAKRTVDAPPLTGTDDRDLRDLTMALLARDPAARPSGDEVLAELARGLPDDTLAAYPPPRGRAEMGPRFVGRAAELAALETAFAASRQEATAVLVGGGSGMGKTSLVRHFLREISRREPVIVLAGRCYEREAVPHGALDGVVDALSTVLFRACEADLQTLIPPDVGALLRLFPVLERLPPFASAVGGIPLPRDPQELRARGFAALRTVLRRLAEARRVVVFIDDLQWGDVDSAAFLSDLVLHPRAPTLLVLATYRSEEAQHSALLRALIGPGGAIVAAPQAQRIDLGGLAPADAITLVSARLGTADGARASRLVAEAAGHPFFLAELARADAASDGEAATADSVHGRLATLLERRWRRLEPAAQAFLAAAALAGAPLPVDVVSRAAGISDESAVLARLHAESLIRIRRVERVELVEPYHDRVRSAVAGALAVDERRALHRSFAGLLESDPRADSGVVLEHWLGAGDRERAGAVAVDAALAAEANLAFHRAAALYRIALDLGAVADAERVGWLTRMGDNRLRAGDLAAAADAYIEAAAGAEARADGAAIDLHRRAFECLLRVGDVERGLEVAGRVVGACGLTLPGSPRAALIGALVEEARLAIGGRRFVTVPPEARDPAVLLRIDVCRSLSSGLGFILPVTAAVFHKKAVRYALRSGDSRRAGLAMIHELGIASITGNKSHARVERIRAAIESLPDFHVHPTLAGYLEATRGLAAFLQGEFVTAAGLLERGGQAMLEDPVTYRWEIDLAKIYLMAALLYSGRLGELTTVGPVLLREALDRGNQYLANGLRAWRSNALWLVLDRPDEARANVACVAHITTRKPFHLVHYFEMASSAQIDLYAGDPAAAWDRLVRTWPQLEGSLLLRMQISRIEASYLRGRCALAMAAAVPGERASFLAEVDRCAARLRREHHGWSEAYADLLGGLAAAQRGDTALALAQLASARDRLDQLGMAMHAAAARRRHGELAGDRAEVAAADDWMRSENVRSPDRMTALWAPAPVAPT